MDTMDAFAAGYQACLLEIRRRTELSKNRGLTSDGVRYIAIGHGLDLGPEPDYVFENITKIDVSYKYDND